MPKELIYSDLLPYAEDDPAARSAVEVSWSREAEHVQLATRCLHAATEESYEPPQASSTRTADGWYIQLDRAAINALIRHLRRARDQAFGRDE